MRAPGHRLERPGEAPASGGLLLELLEPQARGPEVRILQAGAPRLAHGTAQGLRVARAAQGTREKVGRLPVVDRVLQRLGT